MSIDRIKTLRDCNIFRDFTWPADLPNFGRFNLIYGWNVTGKTTISRIFRELEAARDPSIGEVVLTSDNKDLKGTEFPTATIPIRVFNKDFIADNIFRSGGEDVPPILILGKANVENQKRLESLEDDLTVLEQLLQGANQQLRSAERSLDDHCVARGGVVRDLLRKQGPSPFNSYDKRNYRNEAQNMLVARTSQTHLLDQLTRSSLDLQYRASPLTDIKEIAFTAPDFHSLEIKITRLLSETVVSQTIESLRDDADISSWVRSGLDLHRRNNLSDCLFCLQPLSNERLNALEGHFSATYERFMTSLDETAKEIDGHLTTLSSFEVPGSTQFYPHLSGDYQKIRAEVDGYISKAKDNLEKLSAEIVKKRNRPFDSLGMNGSCSLLCGEVVDRLNCLIRTHKLETENLTANSTKAGKQLEMGLLAEQSDTFDRLMVTAKTYQAIVDSLIRTTEATRRKIAGLQIEITEHRRPAEEFNDDLHNYMGHNELHLTVKDNGYTLTRNGVTASQLSEGEETAIGLLYFLKSLTDHRFDYSHGIVVLDDPVSSLDANSLFLAFGFIQTRTKEAGQLFILTHNFTFFRQVRHWFKHIKGQRSQDILKRPARFYWLNCRINHNGRYSTIQKLDPLLENFESDYQFLFSSVVGNVSSSTSSLKTNYALPNIARRLLNQSRGETCICVG